VAVALPRSVFLTLALHGIVEAGAAWLPLDTGYPDDRLRMMLEDARPSLLITSEDQRARFSDIPGWKACAISSRWRRRMPRRWRSHGRSILPISSLPPALPGARKG
jgi:non-ribosomal peptide synthetase component F